jgi:hypothetical protein
MHKVTINCYLDLEAEGLMDKNEIETKLPKSFEKLQAFIANSLKSEKDEEERKASEAMEQEKYKAFCKVLHNIQFAYITQQDSNKADVKEMLECMSGELR